MDCKQFDSTNPDQSTNSREFLIGRHRWHIHGTYSHRTSIGFSFCLAFSPYRSVFIQWSHLINWPNSTLPKIRLRFSIRLYLLCATKTDRTSLCFLSLFRQSNDEQLVGFCMYNQKNLQILETGTSAKNGLSEEFRFVGRSSNEQYREPLKIHIQTHTQTPFARAHFKRIPKFATIDRSESAHFWWLA